MIEDTAAVSIYPVSKPNPKPNPNPNICIYISIYYELEN